jgi:hypothetical protein
LERSETAGACKSAYVSSDIGAPAISEALWQATQFVSKTLRTPQYDMLPPVLRIDTAGKTMLGTAS